MVYSLTHLNIFNSSASSLTIIEDSIAFPSIEPKVSFTFSKDYIAYPSYINQFDIFNYSLLSPSYIKRVPLAEKWYKNLLLHPYYQENIKKFSQEELYLFNQIKNIISGITCVHYPIENITLDMYENRFIDIIPYNSQILEKDNASEPNFITSSYPIYKENINNPINCSFIPSENSISIKSLKNMGLLKQNYIANFFITKKIHSDPIQNLKLLKPVDIELLIFRGKPIFGSIHFTHIVNKINKMNYCNIVIEKKEKFLALRGAQKIIKRFNHIVGDLTHLPIKLK